MDTAVKRLLLAAKITGVIVEAVVGTALLCDPGDHAIYGVFLWMISIGSAVHLLSVRPHAANKNFEQPIRQSPLVLRVAVASVAVFCLTILVIFIGACLAHPAACGVAELRAIFGFGLVGTLSAVAAIWMTWR